MQVGQGCAIIQPRGFGHEPVQQGKKPITAIHERMEHAMRIRSVVFPALIKKPRGPAGRLAVPHGVV